MELRRAEAIKIERMIEQESDNFYGWLKTLGVRPVIRALQEKATDIHQETLESLFNKLPELDERQRKVISRMMKSVANQMMHDPINRVKEMAADKNGAEAVDMFTQIFALESRIEQAEAAVIRESEKKTVDIPAFALRPAAL